MGQTKRESKAATDARKLVADRDRERTPRERALLALALGRRMEALRVRDG